MSQKVRGERIVRAATSRQHQGLLQPNLRPVRCGGKDFMCGTGVLTQYLPAFKYYQNGIQSSLEQGTRHLAAGNALLQL